MRKVFLDDLPKRGNFIDWMNSINYKIKFIYDDINGEVEIIGYDNKNQIITLLYKNDKHLIGRENFKNGKLAFMLGLLTKNYKFKVGDIVNTITGKIEILECVRMSHQKYTQKGYKYKCLIDGDIDYIRECHLVSGVGCKVCYGNKIIIGYNDISTTNPELLKYIVDKEDGYKYACNSGKYINVKCPYCGFEKNMRIATLNNAGFGCNACSDGISYSEKFLINLLNQLNIAFVPQLSKKFFDWCDKYRYDIYINSINSIIEIHGIQHYEDVNGNWETLKQIQVNDLLKENLAKENDIRNYIILDCRKSEINWIKNSIMISELPLLLKFYECDIDWLQCHEFACNSLIKVVCDYWNNGMKSTFEISNKMGLHSSTILDYLKKGTFLKLCNYDVKQSRINAHEKTIKTKLSKLPSVICLNTHEVFDNVHIANKKYGIARESINNNCKNKKGFKSAGKHPITGEKLRWMYYDDYTK